MTLKQKNKQGSQKQIDSLTLIHKIYGPLFMITGLDMYVHICVLANHISSYEHTNIIIIRRII